MKDLYFDTRKYTYVPSSYEEIADGKYVAMITDVKEYVSKTTNDPYLTFTVEIVDGRFKGRKIFDNLFVSSTNQVAKEIVERKLFQIASAIGLVVLEGPSDFVFKPLGVLIGKDKEGKPQIKKYMNRIEASGVEVTGPETTTQPLAQSDSVPF